MLTTAQQELLESRKFFEAQDKYLNRIQMVWHACMHACMGYLLLLLLLFLLLLWWLRLWLRLWLWFACSCGCCGGVVVLFWLGFGFFVSCAVFWNSVFATELGLCVAVAPVLVVILTDSDHPECILLGGRHFFCSSSCVF